MTSIRRQNRPRSIYQYSSMAQRLSGQNYKFFKFLLSFNSQKRLGYKENNTKYRILTRKPRSHVRILIYRTWLIGPLYELVIWCRHPHSGWQSDFVTVRSLEWKHCRFCTMWTISLQSQGLAGEFNDQINAVFNPKIGFLAAMAINGPLCHWKGYFVTKLMDFSKIRNKNVDILIWRMRIIQNLDLILPLSVSNFLLALFLSFFSVLFTLAIFCVSYPFWPSQKVEC